MPVWSWVGEVNKRVFNPMEIRRGKRPVLIHTGRSSGKTYETPLDAHQVDDGYVFILMYGAGKTDWVKNLMASGSGRLRIDGRETDLSNPRLLSEEEAWEILPATTEPIPEWLHVTEYLRMDTAA